VLSRKAPPALKTTLSLGHTRVSAFYRDHPVTQQHVSTSSQFVLAEISPRISGFVEINTLPSTAAQIGRVRAKCPPPSTP